MQLGLKPSKLSMETKPISIRYCRASIRDVRTMSKLTNMTSSQRT